MPDPPGLLQALCCSLKAVPIAEKASVPSSWLRYTRRRRLIQHQPIQPHLQRSSHELGKVHRLAYIAVRSPAVTPEDIRLLAAGCQNDYREKLCPVIRAHAAQHFESVETGQVEVKQHHVGHDHRFPADVLAGAEKIVQSFLAVADDDQLVQYIALLERSLGELDVVGIVFNEQDDVVTIHVKLPDFKIGRVQRKVAPLSTELSAHTRPPCRSTIRCTVARPMPVPGNFASECRRWNGAKSLPAWAMSNPAPLSRTKYVGTPSRSETPHSIMASATVVVNFQAFPNRFSSTTCSRR